MDMERILQRIDRRLEVLRLTPAAASRQATGSTDTIRNWKRALKEGREVGATTRKLIPLAAVLKTTPSWLIDGEGEEEAHPVRQRTEQRQVVVAAYVQAGQWSESWAWDEQDQYSVTVPNDPELIPFQLYAAEVRGPSMNRRYAEGTVIVFTNAIDVQEPLIPGKRYVVERRRASGECEHTVKTLHRDEAGDMWLVPESSDPLHQVPFRLTDDAKDGDEVRIVGRVRFAVSRE